MMLQQGTSQRLDREINAYKALLTDKPQNLEALRKLIIAYSVKGDFDSAFAVLQVAKSTRGRIRTLTRGYDSWNPIAGHDNRIN